MTILALSNVGGVELQGGVAVATNDRPWLQLNLDVGAVAGRWIKLTYASGLCDPLARPVLRCFVGEASHDEVMPGALFGRAIWLGRIPDGATAIWISPTNQPGPFAFVVEALQVVARARLLWEIVRQNPSRAWICFGARAVGMRHLARLQVKRTLCATPLRKYDSWRKLRVRPFDPAKLDRDTPRSTRKTHVRIVIHSLSGARLDIQPVLSQLSAQPHLHWSLAVYGSPGDVAVRDSAIARTHVLFIASSDPCAVLENLEDDDLVVACSSDDLIPDYALAALARAACDHPEVDVLYGDEDFIDAQGLRVSLRLRPDWSALFPSASDIARAPSAIKVAALRKLATMSAALARAGSTSDWLNACDFDPQRIRHIRRVLRTRPVSRDVAATAMPQQRRTLPDATGAIPRASIIVATRDRLDLLACCIEGLQLRTRLAGAEILVVDNDSARDETRAYLANLAHDKRFRILPMPGPFNFSRLCNQAAAQARAPALVFLNNDTEILNEEWLDELLAWVENPEVGAVGAKLLYPDGRVQHAGVVVGIDGLAGHFECGLGAAEPGYFGRLNTTHEVSAVTAACLAVEAKKFFAVGGFDEVNLPVEFSDIDLCLRLTERGWKTLYAPVAPLIHHESASRGASLRPDVRYREQHAYFRARWLHVIRDDAAFHPALSLDALQASLG